MFLEIKGPKHSKTTASMLMMLVEEQSTTKHRLARPVFKLITSDKNRHVFECLDN
ncbi:hypothetical protein DPMN_066056 [Dreissena polymorpha]|uniref:Uncharacterized protein n=1 Tax=Dreissena polymorpha TaxID=45954 RepID=A0A9D4BUP6_DREPO|nr:hypothetical protein DPMN_066056 [Dreissena polymorpha]